MKRLLLLSLLALPLFAQTAVFKSGFENASTLDSSVGCTNQFLYFSGIDATTGFNWANSLLGSSDHIRFNTTVGGPNCTGSFSDYLVLSLTNTTGRTGTATRALYMGMPAYSPSTGVQQASWQLGGAGDVQDLYVRYWIKLDPQALTRIQSNWTSGNWPWRMLFEIKNPTNWRIQTYLAMEILPGGQTPTQLRWHTHADTRGLSDPAGYYTLWSHDTTAYQPEADKWMLMEYYLHRATDASGRFRVAVTPYGGSTHIVGDSDIATLQNGETWDRTYGITPEPLGVPMFTNMYGTPDALTGAYQWIDDFEIWDTPPCGNFPCGDSNPTSSTRAVSTGTVQSTGVIAIQ